jgi:hypothetical protein
MADLEGSSTDVEPEAGVVDLEGFIVLEDFDVKGYEEW